MAFQNIYSYCITIYAKTADLVVTEHRADSNARFVYTIMFIVISQASTFNFSLFLLSLVDDVQLKIHRWWAIDLGVRKCGKPWFRRFCCFCSTLLLNPSIRSACNAELQKSFINRYAAWSVINPRLPNPTFKSGYSLWDDWKFNTLNPAKGGSLPIWKTDIIPALIECISKLRIQVSRINFCSTAIYNKQTGLQTFNNFGVSLPRGGFRKAGVLLPNI